MADTMAPFRFLDLPPELRAMVYPYLMDPNHYLAGYSQISFSSYEFNNSRKGLYSPASRPTRRCSLKRYTPAILLVNRQITFEALPVLYRIPLTIYGSPFTGRGMRHFHLAEFISEEYLQRVQRANIRLEWENKYFIRDLLAFWTAKNSLKELHLYTLPRKQRWGRHWALVVRRIRLFAKRASVHFILHPVVGRMGGTGSMDSNIESLSK